MENVKARASLVYDGRKIPLAPEQMDVLTANCYGQTIGGLQAVLEYSEPGDGSCLCLLRLKNTGKEDTKQITLPKTLDVELPTRGQPVYWRSLNGDSCGSQSFLPLCEEIRPGTSHHTEPLGGRSSNTTGFPYFDIQCGGFSVLCAIGWSGQWSQDIAVTEDCLRISIGLCDADFYLKPGEEVRLPSVLMMPGGEDVSLLRRRFRRLCLEKFSPKARLGIDMQLPCAVQPFDRYFFTMNGKDHPLVWASEEGQLKTLESASRCPGFNTYWLDAAWFADGFPTGVGNYRFAPGFPRGLKHVSDAVHEKGMKMMLWFEPERIYEGSEVYQEHPEMLLDCPEEPHQKLFNLGDDAARGWLKDLLIRFIRENGIDIYRQDFNFEPLPFWRNHDPKNRKGITEMKYVAGLYDLWDSLIAAYPGMLIDNCASGGRRIDFETCRRSVPLWRSDTGCSPEEDGRKTSVWNNNQVLALTEYLPYQAAGVWSMDAYDFRAAATGGVACNFDYLSPDFDVEQCSKTINEQQRYKKYWEGDFYPLTAPSLDETIWSAYQLALADSGVCYFFRRAGSDEAEKTFALSAVEPDREYSVQLTDESGRTHTCTYSGRQLAEGVTIRIPAPRNSLIFHYTAI